MITRTMSPAMLRKEMVLTMPSIFSTSFFSRHHSRFMKNEPIKKLELITQYIKNNYIGFVSIDATGDDKCA